MVPPGTYREPYVPVDNTYASSEGTGSSSYEYFWGGPKACFLVVTPPIFRGGHIMKSPSQLKSKAKLDLEKLNPAR